MRTNVEYMLAARTARHDRGSRAAVMMRIASLSTALGIAVMILTLAVVAGGGRGAGGRRSLSM